MIILTKYKRKSRKGWGFLRERLVPIHAKKMYVTTIVIPMFKYVSVV